MTSMAISPEQIAKRASLRAVPLTDERLAEIIAADDRYYRPLFGSDTASAMATELLELRSTIAAVLHQLSNGEASDFLSCGVGEIRDHPAMVLDAQRDLNWCRNQLAKVAKGAGK